MTARVAGPMSIEASPLIWEPPAARELLRWPLPHQNLIDRWLVRAMVLLRRGQILGMRGVEHVRPSLDPFIVAINHNTRIEALLVPSLLMLHRGGHGVHFLADWNFRLIPGIGFLFSRGGTITVTAKPARPRLLNAFKPLYRDPRSVLDRARLCLDEGRSVGIFPEGTVNRDPRRLLPGRRSAALLSLETGVPIVPIGIRFPRAAPDRPLGDREPMDVHIGPPLTPPPPSARTGRTALQEWHAAAMTEIARLSGKSWTPDSECRQ